MLSQKLLYLNLKSGTVNVAVPFVARRKHVSYIPTSH